MMIVLQWPARALHPNSRVHWSTRAGATKIAKSFAHWKTLERVRATKWAVPNGRLKLCIVFVPPDKRKRDDDGLIASFKAYRDGIASGLGIDDNRFITQAEVSGETCKGGKVVVTIEPTEALKAMGVEDGHA